MKEYLVTWEIDVHANSALEAARAAREIQRRVDSTANAFDVKDLGTMKVKRIDLLKEESNNAA